MILQIFISVFFFQKIIAKIWNSEKKISVFKYAQATSQICCSQNASSKIIHATSSS